MVSPFFLRARVGLQQYAWQLGMSGPRPHAVDPWGVRRRRGLRLDIRKVTPLESVHGANTDTCRRFSTLRRVRGLGVRGGPRNRSGGEVFHPSYQRGAD